MNARAHLLIGTVLLELAAAAGCGSAESGAPAGPPAAADASDDGLSAAPDSSSGPRGDGADASSDAPVDATSPALSGPTLAAGETQTCALTAAGGVACWGGNYDGELGDGTTESFSLSPKAVVGIAAGAVAVSAVHGATCARLATGAVKCWGESQTAPGISRSPVALPSAFSGAIAFELGYGAPGGCLLTPAAGVKCWGLNDHGQLGNGTVVDSLHQPVDVTTLTSSVSGLAVGPYGACALSSSGALKCWGRSAEGELGNGSLTDSPLPVDVQGLSSGVLAASVGVRHTCAVTAARGVKCWGRNFSGELGDGTTTDSPVPVDVAGLSGVTDIAAGADHTCALTSAGAVKCWGGAGYAQLGNGLAQASSVPVDVSGLGSGVVEISSRAAHTCVRMASRAVKCWGDNASGQLGAANTSVTLVPVDVIGVP